MAENITTVGTWQEGVNYEIGDEVFFNSNSYKCLQAHTSLVPNKTPFDAPALWTLIRAGNKYTQFWQADVKYNKGDLVIYTPNNKVYKILDSHTSQETEVPPMVPEVYTGKIGTDKGSITIPNTIINNKIIKDPAVVELYQKWKEVYGVEVVASDGYCSYVYYNGPSSWDPSVEGSINWYSSIDESSNPEYRDRATTSEAHGYGMLAAARMGDKKKFKELFNFFQEFKNANGNMCWAIQFVEDYDSTGLTGSKFPENDPSTKRPKECGELRELKAEETGSAVDGDLDIAYALILAYKNWGSVEYAVAAQNLLDALIKTSVHKEYHHLLIGDWVYDKEDGKFEDSKEYWPNFNYQLATRTSDFALENILAFIEFDTKNRASWEHVYRATVKACIDAAGYSSKGLLGDFLYYDVEKDEYKPIPSPDEAKALKFHTAVEPASGNYTFLESRWDGEMHYNSPRTPWRLSAAKLVTGKQNDKINDILKKWVAFANTEHFSDSFILTNGELIQKPSSMENGYLSGYNIQGQSLFGAENVYLSNTFMAPIVAAATSVNSNTYSKLILDIRNRYFSASKLGQGYTDKGFSLYFGDSITLMCAIAIASQQ